MSLLETDSRDMVACLEYIALSVFPLIFQVLWGCCKTIVQLLKFEWLANTLAGFNFWAQENGLMSPDGVCPISTGPAEHKANC